MPLALNACGELTEDDARARCRMARRALVRDGHGHCDRRMRILSVADATRLAPCIGSEVECVLSENFHSSSAGA